MPHLVPSNPAALEQDGGDLSATALHGTRVRLSFFRRDVRVSVVGVKHTPPDPARAIRGDLGAWSYESRKRLLFLLNNCGIEWATLLTLTYPERYPTCGPCAATHLANMFRSMKKRFPGMVYVWVREYQKRGAPHFHILLSIFGHGLPNLRYRSSDGIKGQGPYGWRSEHRWLSRRWRESMEGYGCDKGEKAGIRFEYLDSPEAGSRYMASYLNKQEQKEVPADIILPGRYWGCSQSVSVSSDVPSVDLPVEEYLAGVEGPVMSEKGWLYSTLHDGRKRAARWLPGTARVGEIGFLPDLPAGTDHHMHGPPMAAPPTVFPRYRRRKRGS